MKGITLMSEHRDILERMERWLSFANPIPNDFDGREELIEDMRECVEEIKRLRFLSGKHDLMR